MNRIRRLNIVTIVVAGYLSMAVPIASGLAEQQQAAQEYREAYRLILDEDFGPARQQMETIIRNHAGSAWEDDARFWACYAVERTASAEEAFECYRSMINAAPKSEWVDDAKQNLVALGHQLAQEGSFEYQEIINNLDDDGSSDDLTLTVLAALADVGDEASVQAILERIQGTENERTRARMVGILEDVETPAAHERLKALASSDPAPRVRAAAVDAVGDQRKVEDLDFLMNIVEADESVDVRKTALREVSYYRTPEVIEFLSRHSKDAELEVAVAATRYFGSTRQPGRFEALKEIFLTSTELKVRKQALSTLGDVGRNHVDNLAFLIDVAMQSEEELGVTAVGAIGELSVAGKMEALKRIAQSGASYKVRRRAVGEIGDIGLPPAVAALGEILETEADARLRGSVAYALAETELDEAVPHLVELARNDPNSNVRRSAIKALGDLGTASASRALLELLNQ